MDKIFKIVLAVVILSAVLILPAQGNGGVFLTLPVVVSPPGQTIELDLSASGAVGLQGAEMVLQYDPQVISTVYVGAGSLAQGWLVRYRAQAGETRISLAGAAPLGAGEGIILRLTFLTTFNNLGQHRSTLHLAQARLFDGNGADLSVTTGDGSVLVQGDEPARIYLPLVARNY